MRSRAAVSLRCTPRFGTADTCLATFLDAFHVYSFLPLLLTQHSYTQGELVSPAVSAAKMAQLLLDNTFESGAHIDYFDLP